MATSTPVQWRINHRLDQAREVARASDWRKSSYSPNESDCVEVAIACSDSS
ncbi:DUF397 domain-containing protein [Actinoallomurus sp. NBC_01490]|uniref:DUF397 domain-containing protein n=1 Tax=Actinoallomurus sp. NBC_01490 TaxID=2903557 RepID=UPI003FA455A9